MSKGPILQGDNAAPLRCVHKTEEEQQQKKRNLETPQIQKKLKLKKKLNFKKIILRSETFQADFFNFFFF